MYTDVGKPHASEDMSDMFVMTGETGSYRYMSPEVFRHESYNIKADCYAFAMIAYQVGKERERGGGLTDAKPGDVGTRWLRFLSKEHGLLGSSRAWRSGQQRWVVGAVSAPHTTALPPGRAITNPVRARTVASTPSPQPASTRRALS
jgi:hypothetical protein